MNKNFIFTDLNSDGELNRTELVNWSEKIERRYIVEECDHWVRNFYLVLIRSERTRENKQWKSVGFSKSVDFDLQIPSL